MARAVFTIVSASLPGPWTIKMAPRRIGIMSPPTHRGEEQGDVSRSFVETSEASHPVSFQIETLGILPVSLVKIVLQLLLSHHPFEISRWNCYFLQFHFVWDVPSAVWGPQPGEPGDGSPWERLTGDQANIIMVGSASNDQQSQSNPTTATSTNVLLVSVAMIQQQCQGWTIAACWWWGFIAQQIGSIDQTMQVMTLVAGSCLFCKYSSWQLITQLTLLTLLGHALSPAWPSHKNVLTWLCISSKPSN